MVLFEGPRRAACVSSVSFPACGAAPTAGDFARQCCRSRPFRCRAFRTSLLLTSTGFHMSGLIELVPSFGDCSLNMRSAPNAKRTPEDHLVPFLRRSSRSSCFRPFMDTLLGANYGHATVHDVAANGQYSDDIAGQLWRYRSSARHRRQRRHYRRDRGPIIERRHSGVHLLWTAQSDSVDVDRRVVAFLQPHFRGSNRDRLPVSLRP